MKGFWFLGLAFVDLAVAGAMVGRGERGVALLFMALAAATAAYALFAKPTLRRDPRGGLQETEPPFASLLGVAGALAILAAAGYIAVSTSRPVPQQVQQRSNPAAQAAASMPARQDRPHARRAPSGNWLHKCVDSAGLASYQSAACPSGSRLEWRRSVAPEPGTARVRVRPGNPTVVQPSQTYRHPSDRRVAKKDSAACQAAREADRRYRAQPLKLVKHDGLRLHGDAIRSACG